ncbi:hypothetical protein ACHAXA_001190 [Cyclostephanos tholiformis]|uniref:Uncharacterized protein n=1 Tax=Cyclostephanos tholiformis TaxID=382380 RepID=A0ABD3SQ11_9STRA
MEGVKNGIVGRGAGTINSDDILLPQRIVDDSIHGGSSTGVCASVSTADLLNILERNVNADDLGPRSTEGMGRGEREIHRANGVDGGINDISDEDGCGGRLALSRLSSANSMSSVDSQWSSFTSRLLGGRTDDHEAIESAFPTAGIDDERDVLAPSAATGRASTSTVDDLDAGAFTGGGRRPSSSQSSSTLSRHKKNNNGNNGNNSNNNNNNRLIKQSFDNPFRRHGGSNGAHGGARGGCGSLSDHGRDDDVASTSAASAPSLGALLQSRDTSSGGASATSGGSKTRVQNSVTFSIQNEKKNRWVGDGNGDHPGGRLISGAENSIQSVDTFSLGSLNGVTVSTRSSRSSRQSSKSSKSSHGSATTTSTHSSGDSIRERRRRRELVPVVKYGGPSSSSEHYHCRKTKESVATVAATSSIEAAALMVGAKYQPKRSRNKASSGASGVGFGKSSSRNLHCINLKPRRPGNRLSAGGGGLAGNDNDEEDEENDEEDEEGGAVGAYHGKNLHNHHPVRYPRRSSHDNNDGGADNGSHGRIDEMNEEKEDDFALPLHRHDQRWGGAVGLGANESEDDDGLFRRVGRVRDGDGQGGQRSRDNFLDDLIASTTATVRRGDGDDSVSVGETSFLSELLAKNKAARHRGGQRRSGAGGVVSNNTSVQSAGVSTMSSHTDNSSEKVEFINIYAGDANNKQQKRQVRSYSQWRVNAATIKQHCDCVMTMMRQSRAFQKIEMFFNEGGDILPQSVRRGHAFSRMEQFYNDGGKMLPQNRKEVAILLVCALVLWPIMHVAITIATGGGSAVGRSSGRSGRNDGGYYGGEIQFVSSPERKQQLGGRGGSSRQQKMGTVGLFSTGESMSTWAGSSQVMLSKYSSLRENFILIPDADWIELQIIRSKAAMQPTRPKSDGGFLSSFFRKSSSTYVAPRKPPKRLPLPSMIDPVHNSSESMVLFSFTRIPLTKSTDDVKHANAMLWRAIDRSLKPRPLDVWPCWSHNSLAQFREDGYTVMYPFSVRDEARMALTKLAKDLGRRVDSPPVFRLYEYLTWSESSPNANVQGEEGTSAKESAGVLRLSGEFVGKDGSVIVIPALPNGRSDIMIHRTIPTASSTSDVGQELAVVMRRVKDLPVEDELTMREWEGPPIEEISMK